MSTTEQLEKVALLNGLESCEVEVEAWLVDLPPDKPAVSVLKETGDGTLWLLRR